MSSVLDGFEADKKESLKRTPSRPRRAPVRRRNVDVEKEVVAPTPEETVTDAVEEVVVEDTVKEEPSVEVEEPAAAEESVVEEPAKVESQTVSKAEEPVIKEPIVEEPVKSSASELMKEEAQKSEQKDVRQQIKISSFSMEKLKALKGVKRINYNNEAFDYLLDVVVEHGLTEKERITFNAIVDMARDEYIDKGLPIDE